MVNVSGAALLGLLGSLALSPHVALLADTAFVGSYTTFSTWMLETQRLGEERQVRRAAITSSPASSWASPRRCSGCGLQAGYEPALPQADHLLRRASTRFADVRQPAFSPTRCWTCTTPAHRDQRLLRGIASFGPRHVLRSDQSLSLPRIRRSRSPRSMSSRKSAAGRRRRGDDGHGLVTLERARLVSATTGRGRQPPTLSSSPSM